MKKLIRNNKKYIIVLLAVICLLSITFFSLGFFYKDGYTLLISDMDAQYKALFIYFKENLFKSYSFGNGLGNSMIGTYAYYLASPFNLISLAFKNQNMHIALMIITFLKLILSSLTMFIFLDNQNKKNKFNIALALTYTFMGFNVAYMFHIMWLDAIYLLPLIMLGIDKITNKQKPNLYIITMFFCILTNYYISFMVCGFSTLYFMYSLYIKYDFKKELLVLKRVIKNFIVSSFLAGALASFILIPTVLEFKNMSKSELKALEIKDQVINITPNKIVSKLLIGNHHNNDILSIGEPQIYSGIITLSLFIVYFLNKKIDKKEKKASFVMTLIFILSLLISLVDLVWHGMNVPICFNPRYTFLISFFMIFIASKAIYKIEHNKLEHYLVVFIIISICALTSLIINTAHFYNFLVFISLGYTVFYLCLLYSLNKEKEKKKLITLLIIFLVFTEIILNMFFIQRSFEYTTKKEENKTYRIVDKEVELIQKADKSKFYRMEVSGMSSYINSFYYGYNGISTFLSTLPKEQINFTSKVGYNTGNNIMERSDNNIVMDSLLGIKYTLQREVKNDYFELLKTKKISGTSGDFYDFVKVDMYIYKNNEALSLGTLVDSDISKCNINYKDHDRLDYQNQLIKCLTGTDKEIYIKAEVNKIKDGKYKLINSKQGTLLLFPNISTEFFKNDESIDFYINDIHLGSFYNNTFNFLKFDNKSANGTEFDLTIKKKSGEKEIKPYAYYFNEKIYKEIFSDLNKNSMNVVKQKNGYIKAKVTVPKDKKYLFTTIPYNKGFKIYVNNREVKYDKVFDTFIGLKLDEGLNIIEFKYTADGLKEGLLISFMVLFITVIYLKRQKELV